MARDKALIRELAEVTADTLAEYVTRGAPPANREAAYLTIMSLIYGAWARVAGGEWVYVPRTNPAELEQARARIALALQAGEPPPVIARREGVSQKTVHRVRRARGQIRP